MKNLVLLALVLFCSVAHADTYTDVMKVVSKILHEGHNMGKTGECLVDLISHVEDKQQAQIYILNTKEQRIRVYFVVANQTGTTIQKIAQVGKKVTISLNQQDTGKQKLTFNGKTRELTISSAGEEDSCVLQ